jgi:hypothetical protein
VVATFERRAILQVREPAGGATAVEGGTIEGTTDDGVGGTGDGPADRAL